MTNQMLEIGNALFCICKTHNKGYCYVSQESLQRLMVKYDDWNRSERTVRRRLKDLSHQGYIKVVHRNWSEVNGVKKFRTNLYIFTQKWFAFIESMARFARKVFSFFRRPKLADYSSLTEKRDLKNVPPTVEFWWKTDEKGRASPLLVPPGY